MRKIKAKIKHELARYTNTGSSINKCMQSPSTILLQAKGLPTLQSKQPSGGTVHYSVISRPG